MSANQQLRQLTNITIKGESPRLQYVKVGLHGCLLWFDLPSLGGSSQSLYSGLDPRVYLEIELQFISIYPIWA
jgi:hypothetical protein